jgi:hypothetical protein
MDKNNNDRLNRTERLELQRLGSEVDQKLLANSHALAQALRLELFDERGRPIKRRFRHAFMKSSELIGADGRGEKLNANASPRTPSRRFR